MKNAQASQTQEAPKASEEIPGLTDMISKKNIAVYPNPTDGIFTVEISDFTKGTHADCRLTDLTGKTISHHKVSHGSRNFNLSHHASGIYLLHVTVDGKSSVWKIVKK